jgi:allophanate hydrolase
VEGRPEILHPTTRAILEAGLERKTVDAFDAFHRLAQTRALARALFSRIDALLLPTAPFTPTLADLAADPIGPNSRLGTFTNFVNLCDLTAFAVPAGFGPDGLPVGVTVLGPAWSEGRLAAIADRIHRASVDRLGATNLPLPAAAEADWLAADEMGLFCIGAHMSGLPLNGQITGLGGRFVREATTEPAYRLFALGNRPGLVRVAGGTSIAGEVWALPAAAIGPLLAMVPPPLGFGSVALHDGPCLGFVAEAAGVAGAEDISALGGWRAFLARV